MFRPAFFSMIKNHKKELTPRLIFNDIIAGIIVAIIALPLSIALGISSGVSPDKGLITAVVGGFIISFLGGSRVQIGGPTGAFVIIIYGIIQKYGMEGLIISTILAGCILILVGLFKMGSFIQYVPYPITVGFTSGIAVVLFSTQIKDFLGLNMKEVPSEFIEKWGSYIAHLPTINFYALLLGVASIFIIIFWAKINKTIPGSLIALILTTLVVTFLKLPVDTIGSRFGNITYHFSLPNFSGINLNVIISLLNPAITIAFLAGIESLLSAVVADGMIGRRHNSNTELIAQGVANISSAIFGGIPVTGAIARTAANVKNGGRTPIAGITHSLTLLLVMLVLMKYATLIPMVTLGAILIVVSYNMSEWHTFKRLLKAPKSDVAVLILTFIFTVLFDLVVAIEVGMVLAMFLFMKKMSDHTHIQSISSLTEDDNEASIKLIHSKFKNVMIIKVNGPLFFGSINTFLNAINEIQDEISILIIQMKHVSVMDVSGFQGIESTYNRFVKKGKNVLFSEVRAQPIKVMVKKGFLNDKDKPIFFTNLDDALDQADKINNLENIYLAEHEFGA